MPSFTILRLMRGVLPSLKRMRRPIAGRRLPLVSMMMNRHVAGNYAASSGTDGSSNVERKRSKTPLGKLDQELPPRKDSLDPFAPFPDNTNPVTGEIGGPTGPEPTRYGDWERKGRVSDF